MGKSPLETVKARKRLKLSKLCSHSIVGKLQCEHVKLVKLSDNDDFIAGLNDGNDEVAAMVAVKAVVTIAALLQADGYLTLALLRQKVFAIG